MCSSLVLVVFLVCDHTSWYITWLAVCKEFNKTIKRSTSYSIELGLLSGCQFIGIFKTKIKLVNKVSILALFIVAADTYD